MAYNGNGNTVNRVSEWKLKEQMCEIGRRIWVKGFCAGNEGNHSYRLSENRFLCTPTGVSKGFLKPDDICVVDGDGKQISGRLKRTSEFLMHAAIYKARPDVKAVIHSHPPHATAFAVAGVELPTCIHPEAEVFLGAVKTAKYVTPGDKRLGESLMPYIKDSNTIILQNHGTVCFDVDLENCYYKLEIVDAYSRILLLAKQVGSIRPLDGNEMKELLELKAKFGMQDVRMKENFAGLACTSDFVQRVGRPEIGSRGIMAVGGGTSKAPATATDNPPASQGTRLDQAIAAMAPQNYSEKDIDQLVQVITDQIMASV